MVMNEDDCYNYRKGNRTDEEFKKDITQGIQLEEKYLKIYIEAYTDRRKHKELSYRSWGNNFDNEIVKSKCDLKQVVKPDYILYRKDDNSHEQRKQIPLEVQTCKSLYPDKCYIRKHKIFCFLNALYDPITKKCIDDKCHILFVVGTRHIGYERFALLKPNFLEKLSKGKIEYPNCMGNKPCYWFFYKDIDWKEFNGRTKQDRLNIMEV